MTEQEQQELNYYRHQNRVFSKSLKEALDKQIKREALIEKEIDDDRIVRTIKCPRCKSSLRYYYQNYCAVCGQRLEGVEEV